MKKRKRLGKLTSAKNFARGLHFRMKNFAMPMRGGFRL